MNAHGEEAMSHRNASDVGSPSSPKQKALEAVEGLETPKASEKLGGRFAVLRFSASNSNS